MAKSDFLLADLSKKEVLAVVLAIEDSISTLITPTTYRNDYSESEIMFINCMTGQETINIFNFCYEVKELNADIYSNISRLGCENTDQIELGSEIFNRVPNVIMLIFGGKKISLMPRPNREMSQNEKDTIDRLQHMVEFVETAALIKARLTTHLNNRNSTLN